MNRHHRWSGVSRLALRPALALLIVVVLLGAVLDAVYLLQADFHTEVFGSFDTH